MAGYSYNPQLSVPGKWFGIDFADVKLKKAIDLMVSELNERVKSFKTPDGVLLTLQEFVSEEGIKVPCYIFEPQGQVCANLLYCHGGGFFLPVQPLMMNLASLYAKELSVKVYLVDYRIMPQYLNPSQFLDCLTILKEIEKQNLPYLLYGESVGGTLAAGLSLYARNKGLRKAAGQCLIYPVLDNMCSKYLSMRQFTDAAWPLQNHLMMWTEYLKPRFMTDPEYLIPMKADSLNCLPKTYIEPQEIDIVKDEAICFAEKLTNAQVPVKLNVISGSYHGFDEDLDNSFVKTVIEERVKYMKKMLIEEEQFQ